MAPFERAYMTSYSTLMVTMALSARRAETQTRQQQDPTPPPSGGWDNEGGARPWQYTICLHGLLSA